MTTAGWADPRRAGPCVMSPTRLIPGAAATTPRPAGRPGRSGAGTIRPGPSPRPTGNRTRRRHDPADHAEREASTPPRAGPARPRRQPVGPFGPVKEPDNDAGRRVLPPPGRRGPGTAPPGAAAGPGCLHPPAHGPDGAVASSTADAADAAVFRAHPDPRAEKTAAPFREPVPHAGLPEPRPQPPDPGAPLRGHGISAETGVLPPPSRDPAPDRPHHRTVRSGHPGHRPGPPDDPENDPPPKPRTASRRRHDPTPPHDHFHPPPEKHQTLQSCSSG